MPEKTNADYLRMGIGKLVEFDQEYFKSLEGENGWVAIGMENCKNQRYFTVLSETGEKLGVVGVYDTENEKNLAHTVVDPKFRGQGLAGKFKSKLMDDLGLDYLTLTIDLNNEASLQSASKSGAEEVSDSAYEEKYHKKKFILRRR